MPTQTDVQQELTVITEALEVLVERLQQSSATDGDVYQTGVRQRAERNILAGIRSVREAVAWLNHY